MKRKQKRRIADIVFAVLAVLFGISMTVLGGIKPVFAAQPETVLSLNSKKDMENIPFEVSNMFPGDSETNTYRVKVVYDDTVTVRFRVDIGENYDKLAEVLKCKVVLKNTEETLYDGLMKDAPKAMDYAVDKTEGGEKELLYEINTYLDNSVGNEYQGQKLAADFVWWIEELEEPLPPEPDDKTEEQEPDDSEDSTSNIENVTTGALSTDTGDNSNLSLWGVVALCAAVLIGMIVFKNQKDRNGQGAGKAHNKVLVSVGAIVLLTMGLAVTTYALLYQAVAVEGNVFQTGTVKINLNDDEPVIEADDFLFEPGMTVVKDFFVENEGSIDVYYRLYFANVEGPVAEVLEVTVKEADIVLYSGKAAEMTRENACMSEKTLGVGEKVWLTATFYYPETEGNDTQKQFMDFDICADAVQTKNNPEKLFE